MKKSNSILTAKQLQEKSDSAIVTFKELIYKLKATNDEANEVKAANETQIASLEAENAAITQMTAKNARVVQNMEKLLEI